MPAEEQKLNVLHQLGQEIKEKREEMGLSLEDVFAKTYIRPDYIEGIESGDYRHLPETVYALGFIRTYLKLIKFDEVYSEFSHWLKKGSRVSEKNNKEAFVGQYAPPPPGFKLASRFWLFVVLALLVVGAATYVAYSWSRYGAPDIKSRNEPALKQEPEPPAAAPIAIAPTVETEEETEEKLPPAKPAPAAVAQKPELKISAVDECWISIRMGSKNEQMTLKKGTSYTVALSEMARVTYGRPWDVVVTLNGKNIGSPYTGGTRKTQINYYSPDGKTGKIEPAAPKPRTP